MRPFQYLRPDGIDQALASLHELGDEVRPIAGGQSLLLEMKTRAATPTHLLSLAELGELRGLHEVDGQVVIGAATTYAEITEDPGAPDFVRRVVSNIADIAVRSMATIGGAACQAAPAFDVPVLAMACDARFLLRSASDERELSAQEFFLDAGKTARRADELLCSIAIPRSVAKRGCAFEKFGLRSHDAALASVAVCLALAPDETVEAARIVVGGCVRRPTRAEACEDWLVGQLLADATAGLGEELDREIQAELSTPRFCVAYRQRLLSGLARRALSAAGKEAPQA